MLTDNQIKAVVDAMRKHIEAQPQRSAWKKGVCDYALELCDGLQDRAEYEHGMPENRKECRDWLLNGADNWSAFSWGGSSLIYDGDIAERLCNPSELKKTRNGERRPNSSEEWLDTQARALFQAARRVLAAFDAVTYKEV